MKTIKDMPEHSRPREKLREKGASALSDEELVAAILGMGTAGVIFAHNHPSGELQPSEADLRMHEQLTEAGKILGLRVLDHVIVTRKGHYSFQEAGLIR
jgi:DNA repair protein RadC